MVFCSFSPIYRNMIYNLKKYSFRCWSMRRGEELEATVRLDRGHLRDPGWAFRRTGLFGTREACRRPSEGMGEARWGRPYLTASGKGAASREDMVGLRTGTVRAAMLPAGGRGSDRGPWHWQGTRPRTTQRQSQRADQGQRLWKAVVKLRVLKTVKQFFSSV